MYKNYSDIHLCYVLGFIWEVIIIHCNLPTSSFKAKQLTTSHITSREECLISTRSILVFVYSQISRTKSSLVGRILYCVLFDNTAESGVSFSRPPSCTRAPGKAPLSIVITESRKVAGDYASTASRLVFNSTHRSLPMPRRQRRTQRRHHAVKIVPQRNLSLFIYLSISQALLRMRRTNSAINVLSTLWLPKRRVNDASDWHFQMRTVLPDRIHGVTWCHSSEHKTCHHALGKTESACRTHPRTGFYTT